ALAGGAILALRLSVPPAMGEALEAAVGLMLVVLGTLAVGRALRWRLHAHPHAHQDEVHVHFHAHAPGQPEAHHHVHLLRGGRRRGGRAVPAGGPFVGGGRPAGRAVMSRPPSGPPARRLIVGITGATGSVYGVRLLQALQGSGVETHLVLSRWGVRTLMHET